MQQDEEGADWGAEEEEAKTVVQFPCPFCNEDMKNDGFLKCPFCLQPLDLDKEGNLLDPEDEVDEAVRERREREEDEADAREAEMLSQRYAVPAEVKQKRPVIRSAQARQQRWTNKAERRAVKMGYKSAADRLANDPQLRESLTAHYGADLMAGRPKGPPSTPVAKAAAALVAAVLATRPPGAAGAQPVVGNRQTALDLMPEASGTVISIGLLLITMLAIFMVGCMCGCMFCPCCRHCRRFIFRCMLHLSEGDLRNMLVRDVCVQSQTTYTWSSTAPRFVAGNQGFGASGTVDVGSVRQVRKPHFE
jgi:hypothetical protein